MSVKRQVTQGCRTTGCLAFDIQQRPIDERRAMRPVNKHKMELLTWMVLYPMITRLLVLLGPVVGHLALPVRTFLLTAIIVPTMVYLVMPIATSKLKFWLNDFEEPRMPSNNDLTRVRQ